MAKIGKSAEIQRIENSCELLVKHLREVLGDNANVEIYVTGVDRYTMEAIAKEVTDDEGDLIKVESMENIFSEKVHYIRPHFNGNGYELPQISQ